MNNQDIQTFVDEVLLDGYGATVLGGTFFGDKDHADKSEDLEDLYNVVKGLIREHDKLADKVNPDSRILGKRGRKPEEDSVPTTTDDIRKRLVK